MNAEKRRSRHSNLRSSAFICGLILLFSAAPAHALRPNLRSDLKQLENLGRYEEALFFRRSTMDMILAIHAAWSGAPYDPAMDAWIGETRTDRRYWNMVNGQKRAITELLAKAHLTQEQLDRLEQRVRVYVEDHLSPEFDEMGNFYFRRKAMALEHMGLFYDAHFRRRLLGYYCQRVCAPYYDTIGRELEQNGQKRLAAAYRAKADFYLAQAQREFRRSNGDRLISQHQSSVRQPMNKTDVMALLKAQTSENEADAKFAAEEALAELGEGATKAATPAGLAPGIAAEYFSDPSQHQPVATKVLPAADIGLCGNERFPDRFRPAWEKDDILPPNASGQFLIRFRGKLIIPEEGQWRFYVKTDRTNRATVRISASTSSLQAIISPRNDKLLLYSVQNDFNGQVMTRVDFSEPISLHKGLIDVEIEYKGAQAKGPHGTAGLNLRWSSDDRVMESVPASAYVYQVQQP